MKSKKVISQVAVLLVLANVLGVAFLDFQGMQHMRLASTIIFLILFVWLKGYKNVLLLLAFFSLVCADFFIHFFETVRYVNIALAFRGLAAICICLDILPKIIRLKYRPTTMVMLFSVALLNVFLLYKLLNLTQMATKDSSLAVVVLFYGALHVFLAILAFTYSYGYGTVEARFCLVFVYAIIISNVLTSSAYYLGFDILYYFSRPLYVLGLAGMLAYSVLDFDKKKPLEI